MLRCLVTGTHDIVTRQLSNHVIFCIHVRTTPLSGGESPLIVMEQGDSVGPSSDMKAFREVFSKAKNIVVLSGAGISAESGVPTFR